MTKICIVCNKENQDNATICQYCGSPLVTKGSHPFALPVGTQLKSGKYRVGKFLGSGGFGITYKGSDVSAKRVVAIKELFLEGSSRKDCTVIPPYHKCSKTDYEETIKKFEQEGLLLMKFNDPHIVKVLDVFRENNTAYLIMEYLDGENLAEYVYKNGKLDEKTAIDIMIKICEAVEVVHKQKIIHRDIKPSNVIKTKDNRYVLIDFGTARTFISGISKSMTPIATPLYAPPEAMLSKGQFDQRYDIYSLGALFYFLLTAEDPPTCETVETSDGLDKIQNPKIKNIIRTCMSRQVSNRYTNVSLLITALKDVSKRTKPLLPITTQELQEIFDQKEVNVSETINMVKNTITKWFTNYPGQSIVNLPQRLVFNKMFNYPIYYIVLTTLFEEKKCESKEKPYEGEFLPYTQRITIFDVDVSSLDCLLNDDFKNDVDSEWLIDSMEKEICYTCDGSGILRCRECDGDGKVECIECGGDGKIKCRDCQEGFVRCPDCYGNGEIEERCRVCNGWGKISQQCPVCNGSGRVQSYSQSSYSSYSSSNYTTCSSCRGSGKIEFPCPTCGGRGKITRVCAKCRGSGKVPCNKCDGSGYVICRKCGGSGKVVCRTCDGSGHVICYRCKGRRELLKYVEYTDTHKVNELKNTIFTTKFNKSYVESILEENYYKLVVQRDTSKLIDDTILNTLPDFIKNSIKNLVTQEQNKIVKSQTRSCQVIRQKLDIYRSDIYLANVKFDNKDYQFWVYGKQHNVQPVEHNPISDLYELYKNKIIELFEKKEYQELYFLLEKSIADFKPKHKEICELFTELLKTKIISKEYKEAQQITQQFVVLFKPYEDEFYKLFSEEVKKQAEKRDFQKANEVYSITESLFPKKVEELKHLSYTIDFYFTLNEIEENIKQIDVKKVLENTQKILKSPVFDKEKLFSSYYTSLEQLCKQKKFYEAYRLLADFAKILRKQLKIKKLSTDLISLKKQMFNKLALPLFIGLAIGVGVYIFFVKEFVVTTIFLTIIASLLTAIIFGKLIVYKTRSFVVKLLIGLLISILFYLIFYYFNITRFLKIY